MPASPSSASIPAATAAPMAASAQSNPFPVDTGAGTATGVATGVAVGVAGEPATRPLCVARYWSR